jgi:hypothetical protein
MDIKRIYEPRVELSLWIIAAILGTTALLCPPWKFVCRIQAEGALLELDRPGPFASIFNIPPVPVDKVSPDGVKTTGMFNTEHVEPVVDILRLFVVISAIGILCGIPITVIRKKLL